MPATPGLENHQSIDAKARSRQSEHGLRVPATLGSMMGCAGEQETGPLIENQEIWLPAPAHPLPCCVS